MNHPLAVYTVIYVAILFVTVSIWGGKIGEATGDYRVLLLALGIFGLKLAIDDYVHFLGAKNKLHADLSLSLLIYLLLAVSIATAASERGSVSAVSFALVFIVGALWLSISGFKGAARSRRLGWLFVNLVSATILMVVAFTKPPQPTNYTTSSVWLTGLVVLLVFDFFYFGTLKRLAMTTEENRATLDHVFAETAKGNGRPFVEMLANNVSWTIIGTTAWSKTYVGKKAVLEELLGPLNAQLDGPNVIKASNLVAEGDTVVVEAQGQNRSKSGKEYANTYCWLFHFNNGKVVKVIEYTDTALIETALEPPALAS
ncbi:nuclear transport factor 2 family protein [Pseudomonas sp. NyZ704]|nr:nuclear transport factor 2 family protein [Pseudomonas sp. NyZ704]